MNRKARRLFLAAVAVGVVLIATWLNVGSRPMPEGALPDGVVAEPWRSGLLEHFSGRVASDATSVRWEFLRNAPTQAGVSFVKYYAWVRVYAGSTMVAEGAVRVAQLDEGRYQVTDFLSVEDVRAAPASVARVFPKPLVQAILKRAGAE